MPKGREAETPSRHRSTIRLVHVPLLLRASSLSPPAITLITSRHSLTVAAGIAARMSEGEHKETDQAAPGASV